MGWLLYSSSELSSTSKDSELIYQSNLPDIEEITGLTQSSFSTPPTSLSSFNPLSSPTCTSSRKCFPRDSAETSLSTSSEFGATPPPVDQPDLTQSVVSVITSRHRNLSEPWSAIQSTPFCTSSSCWAPAHSSQKLGSKFQAPLLKMSLNSCSRFLGSHWFRNRYLIGR